jgi:DNA-binding LacI/PurR family transcriptional regulator
MLTPSPDFVRRVCAQSGCARSTLLAFLANRGNVREASRLRIERAMAELGLPLPQAMAITSSSPLVAEAMAGKTIA